MTGRRGGVAPGTPVTSPDVTGAVPPGPAGGHRGQDGWVLSVDLTTVRLFLHVLAATVWVGGQLVLAALVPVLRRAAPDAPRRAARAFNRVAWPAFAVLVATGIWNVLAVGTEGSRYRTTLVVKLVLVAASGIGALLHAQSKTVTGLAVWGAVTGAGAVGALFVGVLLAG